ncbi:FtsW/RodA/SpoVE family cell cycle protein [Acetivibrio saccincola]|jgi:cell division protein FtsW (lipid II flippase)|uniref:Lipid II flippase FtsW n=1 Tax=Acetivibrio saccincola TaxID=1677857 RepID=A0A2K9DY59_9FIRM|nr:FtsW/RodA/SpoVE family cell cycle protein [Acetivibrio saccincola]AUG56467.1 Lipid II flippase FtsW [Acetivibrio saccincola]NLW27685.1 FtsW/RodA/SpoVE family cell cycle protein [Acetivibrio saccincola]
MFRKIAGYVPLSMIIFANIIGYTFLAFREEPYNSHAFLMCFIVLAMICISYTVIIKKRFGESYLFLIVSMLLSIGIMMIYRLDSGLAVKQVIWMLTGIIAFFTCYYLYLKIDKWHKYYYLYIVAPILLYILTLVFGTTINGAKNWIIIAGFSFQPSELNKILYVFFLGSYFKSRDKLFFQKSNIGEKNKIFMNRVLLMFITYLNVGFLALQRDWGTIAILLLVYLFVLYIFSEGYKFLILNCGLLLPTALIAYKFFYHVRVRVEIWINPWEDILGKGYQIAQSLFGIGSGGFFGTGLRMGKPYMIPFASTDFIFSAICEEMGTLTGVAVVLLYMLLCYRAFKIALNIKRRFEKIVVLGLILLIGMQTFIIIGGVIKLIPLTGTTLPYVSYGGSSLVTSFIILGILQAISRGDFSSEGENYG